MKYYKENIIISVVFSMITIFGESYKKIDSWNLVFNNPFRSIGLFSLYFIIFYLFVKVFLGLFFKISLVSNQKKKLEIIIFDEHPFIGSFIIIFICYLPFLIIKYPGTPGWDFYCFVYYYCQSLDGITQHLPLFYVLFCVYIIKIGEALISENVGIYLLTLFHAFIMICSFSLAFIYLKKWNISYKYRIFVLLFYAITPLFSNYSTTIYHDVLYSSFILIYILNLTDVVIYKTVTYKKIIILSILSYVICITRKNGIFIIIPTDIILIFRYIGINKKNIIKNLIVFLVVLIYFIGNYIISFFYERTSILEALAIPIQTIARYSKYYNEDINDEDKKNIEYIIDYQNAGVVYNPTIVDDVKYGYCERNFLLKEFRMFLKSWIKLFFKHPNVYIEAFINNTYQLYYPFEKTTFFFFNTVDEYYCKNNDSKLIKYKEKLHLIQDKLDNTKLIGRINDPGIYVWLTIILFSIIRKNKLPVIPFIPIIMTILCCLAGPTIDYNTRYAFPIIFSIFPLMAFYSYMINLNKKE